MYDQYCYILQRQSFFFGIARSMFPLVLVLQMLFDFHRSRFPPFGNCFTCFTGEQLEFTVFHTLPISHLCISVSVYCMNVKLNHLHYVSFPVACGSGNRHRETEKTLESRSSFF